MQNTKNTAIVLLNMGGPNSLDEVEVFLKICLMILIFCLLKAISFAL